MIKGKTESGFEYSIPRESLNNYELVENIAELEEKPLLITSIVKQLLGEEQAKNLKEHVRKDGIVSIDRMSEEIINIFKNSGTETKNS